MTQKEIEETAQRIAKGEIDLVDWLDNQLKEDMKKLGFTEQETPTPQMNNKDSKSITGTIMFIKGKSPKRT